MQSSEHILCGIEKLGNLFHEKIANDAKTKAQVNTLIILIFGFQFFTEMK
jgi:hypothetical protein